MDYVLEVQYLMVIEVYICISMKGVKNIISKKYYLKLVFVMKSNFFLMF